jgi:hypothetical protein
MSRSSSHALQGVPAVSAGRGGATSVVRATFVSLDDEGRVHVRRRSGEELPCLILDNGAPPPAFEVGDELLVLLGPWPDEAVVLGRAVPFKKSAPPRALALEATESVSLRAGAATVELRADGKVMIRGDDVLVRAKGTQRIRAGTVSIN